MIALTTTERLILERLQTSPGVVTFSALYYYARPNGESYSERQTLRSHISSIRRKIGFHKIKTHRDVGYSLSDRETCLMCNRPLEHSLSEKALDQALNGQLGS